MLKRSLVIAIGLLLATAAGAHAAATLTTAPFPGYSINQGSALCALTNAGKKAGTVTLELLDPSGASLATNGPETLPPGASVRGDGVLLSDVVPVTCRFTVPSRAGYRGSFQFLNGNVPPTVIPAQ